MGMIFRMDRRGHGVEAKWGSDRLSQHNAQKVFNAHIANHYDMADISGGRDGVFITAFDPNIEEILAVPKMVSG